MVITQNADYITPFGGGAWNAGFGLYADVNGSVKVWSKSINTSGAAGAFPLNTPFNLRYGYDGSSLYFDVDGVRKQTLAVSSASQSGSITHPVQLNQQTALSPKGNYAIQKAKLTVNNAVVFDCDLNGSTSIRHGDTKFQAAVGGPVSLTRAGQDPVTVVKKDILRFDGANDFMEGLLNQAVTGVHFFASFSVLGNGGESYGRILGLNPTGGVDYGGGGVAFRRNSDSSTPDLMIRYNANNITTHSDFFDEERGDYLLDVKVLSGSQKSKVNNADLKTGSVSGNLNAAGFSIASLTGGGPHEAALDLEFLALFPATITDDQADSVRNYINNRNNVFDLKDGFGYFFYDAQKAPAIPITSGSSSWNGRIVGSDNGDANKYATQSTANDSPVGNGYTVTFADNTDHLDIPSTTQAGWQICGTSLGTFAYRVDNDAVTELNLLGNAGNAGFCLPGELYGIMLLPETATTADLNNAKKLLLDRGANEPAEGAGAIYYGAWYQRRDIVEFQPQTFPNAVNMGYAWSTNLSLNSFGAIQAPLCTNFSNAWQNTPALTSFPAGAKLGTAASNVNFTSAWQSSGLTSFPALDLSKGNNFNFAFNGCSSLTSFPGGAKLGTAASNVQFLDTWKLSGLTSFPADIDLSKGTYFRSAWRQSALTSFPAIESLKNGGNFSNGWLSCTSLTDFAAVFTNWNPASIASGVFDGAWGGCSALSAQSVENILTSIDASGKYATTNGASGGTALGDAGIDIDYNVSTGSLSAATNSAVTSLKAKGWSIIVNNVTL